MISVGELAEWVIENRRGKAFYGYTFGKVIDEIIECQKKDGLLIISDGPVITGVICCEDRKEAKILFVYDILTTSKKALKQMLKYCIEHYPGYIIEGLKKTGKKRTFTNPTKLLCKLH